MACRLFMKLYLRINAPSESMNQTWYNLLTTHTAVDRWTEHLINLLKAPKVSSSSSSRYKSLEPVNRRTKMSALEILVITIGIIMGIFGNVLILIVMISNAKLRQLSTSSLIISMAVVDCLSAAFTNPLSFSLVRNSIDKFLPQLSFFYLFRSTT